MELPTTGVFIDWAGKIRKVEAPGDGLMCRVVECQGFLGVDVYEEEENGLWCVIQEATYYASEDVVKEKFKPLFDGNGRD